jgi:hypothetical protein
MSLADGIMIENTGNCHINFGLQFIETSPYDWSIGYNPSYERFVLRAQFTKTEIAPSDYDHVRDFMRDVITWAGEDAFGKPGKDLSLDATRWLWFEFLSPIGSEFYGANELSLQLVGRANIP